MVHICYTCTMHMPHNHIAYHTMPVHSKCNAECIHLHQYMVKNVLNAAFMHGLACSIPSITCLKAQPLKKHTAVSTVLICIAETYIYICNDAYSIYSIHAELEPCMHYIYTLLPSTMHVWALNIPGAPSYKYFKILQILQNEMYKVLCKIWLLQLQAVNEAVSSLGPW